MRADDPIYDSIPDTVFDLDSIDDGRGDKELVLDVDKVVGELDSCVYGMVSGSGRHVVSRLLRYLPFR